MFGIGMSEVIIILVIALLVIGPKKLPNVARSIGKGLREFRRATTDLKDEFQVDELEDLEVEEDIPPEEKKDEEGEKTSEDAVKEESAASQDPEPPSPEPSPIAAGETPPLSEPTRTASAPQEEGSESQPKAPKDHD
ncbi:MAG: twin-arginine translocase TatA/TatE family subunit [Nitrospinota bacterium]